MQKVETHWYWLKRRASLINKCKQDGADLIFQLLNSVIID